MKYCIQCIFILFLLGSCGNPMGDMVKTNNLDVYYMNGIKKEQAVAFTKFWKRNGFIGKDAQTIQLEIIENDIVNVNLIEKKTYQNKAITYEEQLTLNKLQKMIRDSVFTKNRVNIVITDNTFKPLEREL